MTRRAKLQAALDVLGSDAADVLRDFTAEGGSGIDAAVQYLFDAAQPEVSVESLTIEERIARLEDAVL